MGQKKYFRNPHEAVELTSNLLLEENFAELLLYYDLEGQNEAMIDSLRNGSYFIRPEKPESVHPGGFWKYKYPFPPGFNYHSHYETTSDTVIVKTIIEIDQGDGMLQKGFSSFPLKITSKGYQHIVLRE